MVHFFREGLESLSDCIISVGVLDDLDAVIGDHGDESLFMALLPRQLDDFVDDANAVLIQNKCVEELDDLVDDLVEVLLRNHLQRGDEHVVALDVEGQLLDVGLD